MSRPQSKIHGATHMKAIARRAITHGTNRYEAGAVFDLPVDQFREWEDAGLVEADVGHKAKPKPEPKLTVAEYVDGYMARKWGDTPPAYVIQFAENNAVEIEAEFQRRAA